MQKHREQLLHLHKNLILHQSKMQYIVPDIDIVNSEINITCTSENGVYGINLLCIYNELYKNNIDINDVTEDTLNSYYLKALEPFHKSNANVKYVGTYDLVDKKMFSFKKEDRNINYNYILRIFVRLWQTYNFKYPQNMVNVYNIIDIQHIIINKHNMFNNDKKFISRIGVIELQAVNVHLFCNKSLIKEAMGNIMCHYSDEQYIYTYPHTLWITYFDDVTNIETTIKKLITNAGFYINKSSSIDENITCFDTFCTEYINALKNTTYLQHFPDANAFGYDIYKYIKHTYNTQFNIIPIVHNHIDFITMVNNKSILLLTPFKHIIDMLYTSGDIYKLYNDINFANIKLYTIEAILTTYPNSHLSNWTDTFDHYKKIIDNEIRINKIDMFISTAGCYGLPICNTLFKVILIKDIKI